MSNVVEVFEWAYTDGTVFGCGTKVEFDYWKAEGVIDPEAVFGKSIGFEPASEDDRRRKCWGLADMLDAVPA
jgi:hypothetical protein